MHAEIIPLYPTAPTPEMDAARAERRSWAATIRRVNSAPPLRAAFGRALCKTWDLHSEEEQERRLAELAQRFDDEADMLEPRAVK